jgi:hypothetical protein
MHETLGEAHGLLVYTPLAPPRLTRSSESSVYPDSVLAAADRHRHFLFLSIAGLYLLGFNGQWQPEPDSALYLILARNLARGLGYTYHGLDHNLVYPGLPYAMSIFFRASSAHAIAALDALILLCGWIALALTYRLFSLACDRPTAVVITVLTALAHEYFRYCYEIMTEMPFLIGVMGVLAGYEGIFSSKSSARWWDWAIFITGAFIAVNIKPMMLILLSLCIIDAAWRARRHHAVARAAIRATGIAIISIALALLFYAYEPRHPFSGTSSSYEQIAAREVLDTPSRLSNQVLANLSDMFGRSAARTILGTPLLVPAASAVFGLIVIFAGISLWRFRPLWGMWVVATLAKLILLYSNDRYFIPILPLLIFGWWRLMCAVPRYLSRKKGNFLFATLLLATVLDNAATTGAVIVRQHLHPFIAHFRDGHFLPLSQVAGALTTSTNDNDVILAPAYTSRILTFLADRTVLDSTDPMIDLHGHRLFVIESHASDNHQIDAWLHRIHVTRTPIPVLIIPSPQNLGGPRALYQGTKY